MDSSFASKGNEVYVKVEEKDNSRVTTKQEAKMIIDTLYMLKLY